MGWGVVMVPPRLNLPTSQAVQFGPPSPGSHILNLQAAAVSPYVPAVVVPFGQGVQGTGGTELLSPNVPWLQMAHPVPLAVMPRPVRQMHFAEDVDPMPAVVMPAGHLAQLARGSALSRSPPADQVPREQLRHSEPPVPGGQGVGM